MKLPIYLMPPRRCSCGKITFEVPKEAKYVGPEDGGHELSGYYWVCTVCGTNTTRLDHPIEDDEEVVLCGI